MEAATLKQELPRALGNEGASASEASIWDTSTTPSVAHPDGGVSSASVSPPSVSPPSRSTLVGLTPVPREPVQASSISPPGGDHSRLETHSSPSSVPPAPLQSSETRTPVPRGVLAPGEQFGVYHVGTCIGEGGMARIYQAEHAGLRRQVALKVLLDASTRAPEGRERFLREARIAAAIKHPNVVNIFDVGVHEDTAFLVMELLTGTDLEQLIQQRGALDEGTIIDIMIPVLAGLTAVHDAGVVHRDLKPGNVFLAQGRYDEVDPKLLDFGISKAPGPDQLRLTANGMLIGTPFYMSPEGLRGEEMSPASDQYSLGVVMYECATGTNPFHASTFAEIFRLIGAGQYPPPSSTQPQISKRLERVIMRAMSLDPERRYKDLREMGRDLLLLAGQRTRITWSLSFGELDRPRASSTSTWKVPERAPAEPTNEVGVTEQGPKRRWLMPVSWAALGAAVVVLGIASSGVFSSRPAESKLPEHRAAALTTSASRGSSIEPLAAGPANPATAIPADEASLPARAMGSVAGAKPTAHRTSRPERRSSAAQSGRPEEINPDWAVTPSASTATRVAGQPRGQVGVGPNGAPIFD